MHGEAKVPFVRHSVQREAQSFADQTSRLRRLSCKNRGSAAVPQQDGTGGARRRGKRPESLTFGVGQTHQSSRGGTHRPARRWRDKRPAAVPHGFGVGSEHDIVSVGTSELAGLTHDKDCLAGGYQAGAARCCREDLARAKAREEDVEAVAPGRPIAAAGADEGGGHGAGGDVATKTDQVVPDREDAVRRPRLDRGGASAAQAGASATAGVAGVGIGRVVNPAGALPCQPVPKLGSSGMEQRTQQHEAPPLRPYWRRRPFSQLAEGRAFGPHQIGLGDVVGSMGEKDDTGAGGSGGFGDQGVAGGAGGGLHPGGGLVAGPAQGLPVSAQAPRMFPRTGGPGDAVGVEAMVHRQGQQAANVCLRPSGHQMQQGDGIAAAGQGDGNRMIDMGFELAVEDRPRLRQPARNDRAQPGLRAGGRAAGAAQAKRVRISVARARRAAEEASA